MLAWFKDLIAPIHRDDPRFGVLRYLRDARFWEGKVPFRPTKRQIEVLVSGQPTGPTEDQRKFFDALEGRYDALWPAIKEKLDMESQRVGAVSHDFELVSIRVPERFWQDAEWELSYETRSPLWHFTVRLRGWTPAEAIGEC
jgi:hypothetical protein